MEPIYICPACKKTHSPFTWTDECEQGLLAMERETLKKTLLDTVKKYEMTSKYHYSFTCAECGLSLGEELTKDPTIPDEMVCPLCGSRQLLVFKTTIIAPPKQKKKR